MTKTSFHMYPELNNLPVHQKWRGNKSCQNPDKDYEISKTESWSWYCQLRCLPGLPLRNSCPQWANDCEESVERDGGQSEHAGHHAEH